MNCLADVSQRLQNALDSNYNVIDMSTVLEVITVLEGTTITKEQLETTRLAKYINQLRRKTSNEHLARRSKNLLKKWREMVIPNQNTVQPQATTNAPSSAISPPSNRLIGATTLSNGSTPTTQHLSTYSPHSQGVKGTVLSKENMIRRPMPTTPQSSVQHKSSSMPMTGMTTSKFPLPILNTNNGSNSSMTVPHMPITNTATINSTKPTSRLSSAQPISFANLISQAETKQHIDGPNKANPTTISSNRNMNTIDITSIRSQSPKMPKNPRRNNVSGATVDNNRSASPIFLMGNRTTNFRLPPHNDIDDANSRPSFTSTEHKAKIDQPNNNSRKTFNGFGNMFMSNAKISPAPTVPFSASELHDSHSDSSSMIIAPVSSMSLPMSTIAGPAISMELADSQKHKKRKRQEKNKERDINRLKDVSSLGGTSFDHSMSNSSLGMFNSTTNTTNTTNLGNAVPSIHKLSELTFTGKFSKSDDAIINIDTTSGSSSPRQLVGVRTDSPMLMHDSPCGSPMLSVENSNESATGDSLPKSSNNLLASATVPVTTVPLETLDASRLESTSLPIPKKRGRKKGSTGVDRNMSLAGPSGSSGTPYLGTVSLLKTKMDLMRSVKKVKTTKELLAELQNRKPTLTGNGSGSTNSSPMLELPVQSLVSPSSLCSDNSQTNSTDMRSTTATPVSLQTAPTPEPHLGNDSLANNDQPKKHSADSKTIKHKAIDDEIAELRRQLPPIDIDAVNNWTDHDDELMCTCKLIELDPPVPDAVLNTFDRNMEGDEKVLQIEVKLTKIDEQLPKVPPDLSDGMRMGKSIKPLTQIQPQEKPRMKSIFDLDFDDDDDPIHRFKANSDEIKVDPVDNAVVKLIESNNSNSMPSMQENQNVNVVAKSTIDELSVPCLPPPPIPFNEPTISQRFEVREDVNCPAKSYFITSKNCVTQYHVDTLHNCFLPNVNGNWSVSENGEIKSESVNDYESDELKFVPKYDHMRLDKIPKNLRDFDVGWYRQRKLRKKVDKIEAADIKPIVPDSGIMDQDETEVISSRLSNSSQTNVIDHVTDSDGRDELNCDLKTSCMDDVNVEDVTRINELEAMDGQSEECIASTESRKRKGSKRKSVKYKIRKSSSDFSRDIDGPGGPYDGIGDGRDPKIVAPTRIILKLSRQVTTDADMEEEGDDDDYDDDDDESEEDEFLEDEEERFDEDDEENIHEEEHEKDDDLLEYNDQSNCHSNDNIREIRNVENNNDNSEKFDRNVDLSTDVMDVDHFKLRRFSEDDHKSPTLTNFDDAHLSPPSSSHLASIIPINHLPTHSHPELFQPHLNELNHSDSNPMGNATTPQSIDYDDDDKTAEQLPLENNEQLASFNNVSNENESGVRTTDGLEFKEWHEVVRVRSYNDELLTILPYVVID